ncbi:MAG: YjfB family protein [Phycisphaeraceae bacterium]
MNGIASTAGSNAHLMQEVGMRVASKAMDIAREEGAAVEKLLEKASEVQEQGRGGDGEPSSVGGRIDVTG